MSEIPENDNLPQQEAPAAMPSNPQAQQRQRASQLAQALRGKAAELGVQMLGPAPAPLALLRGRKRFTCLIKGQDWQAIRSLYFFALAQKASKHLRLFLDLDPINML